MKRAVCLYLHMHQPFRVRQYSLFDSGRDDNYFYEADPYARTNNQSILEKVADKSYRPTLAVLEEILAKHQDFCFSLSVTGTLLRQLQMWAPDVLETLQRLVETGRVELVAETYQHSLAFFFDRNEFEQQVNMHARLLKDLFDYKPTAFRNTELSYNNDLAYWADKKGYKVILAEGWDKVLAWRSPNYVYRPSYTDNIRLLMKNYSLSDDIAFRFTDQGWSGYPLTSEKYVGWLNSYWEQPLVNLFMDFETFGEHQWADSGIYNFLRGLADKWLEQDGHGFMTVTDASQAFDPVDEIDCPQTVTWADTERDLSAWLGNAMQTESTKAIYALSDRAMATNNSRLIDDWRLLQTSDHFYYMCTKWFNDGDIHAYFSPYETPYEAFIYYMNVIRDFALRLTKCEEAMGG